MSVVAAEQRVRLVRHAVPDHGRLAPQQLPVQGLERGAGIGAELVAQRAPVRLVPGQRRGRAQRRRLAAQQLQQDLLVARLLARPASASASTASAWRPSRDSASARARTQRPVRRRRGPRAARDSGSSSRRRRRPGPPSHSASPASACGERRRVVAGPGVPRARGRAEQHGGAVDLVLGEGEPVAGRRAGDDVGAQLRAGAGDEDLQRLGRVLRLLVRPEPLHQPGGAAARAQVAGQQREQPAQPRAGDLLAAVGHPRQQDQVGGHQARLVTPRRSPPRR